MMLQKIHKIHSVLVKISAQSELKIVESQPHTQGKTFKELSDCFNA